MAVNWSRGVLIAAVLAALGGSALAQFGVQRLIVPGQSGSPADLQGVYVKDSAIATDKMRLAERMERLKEWHKSADVYQELIEKYKDRVVATAWNDKEQPTAYASVIIEAQHHISKWPEDGLTVYRNRFEPAAATLLEQAKKDDFAALHKVLDQYFATDSAKQAGMRLMELYLDEGDFAAAAWIGDRLLDWHPNLLVERPAVLFRTAIAYHLAGNASAAKKRLDELKAKSPDATGTVAGHDVKLVEELERQFAQATPAARGTGADSWRKSIGGNESNDQISSARTSIGAPVWHIDFPLPYASTEALRSALKTQWENARNSKMTINVFPAVDRGEMFFQDGQRLWGVHVESGTPLSGWQQTYAQRNGVFLLPVQSFAAGDPNIGQELMLARQNTVTITDDAVLAVMGYPDLRVLAGMGGGDSGTRLVCLDRATGLQRWIANPNAIPKNDGNARMLTFSGEPLVVGDNVYTIVRGSTGAGVEDCHVVCYQLESGQFKWSCYIASSQNGFGAMMGGGMPAPMSDDTLSHLAFSSGRVFVSTNLGAVAAVDAYSGATAWLTIYERSDDKNTAQGPRGAWGWNPQQLTTRDQNAPKPWEFNPVIVSDGKVFVYPTDAKGIHIYDAGTGKEIKRIPAQFEYVTPAGTQVSKLGMLLAVRGDRMFVTATDVDHSQANSHYYCLDWQKFALKPGRRSIVEDSVLYFQSLARVEGRPYVTASQIYLPLDPDVVLITMKDGDPVKSRIVQAYPKGGARWPAGENPGNVLVSQDNVIIANRSNITVYTDMSGIRQKYDKLIAQNPTNIGPRLIYAELLFNAGESKDAIKTLDAAIEALGGLKSMARGENRDRVFADAITFATKMGADKEHAIAAELFDRAAAAVSTPSQAVNYRLSRAKYIEQSQGQVPVQDAVHLYQEILSDSAMRIVSLASEDANGSMQAGTKAEEAIAALIKQQGASVYAEFEKQAADKLAALKDAANPDDLLALAENYPNAAVAPRAMLQAAQVYERTRPRMATQVLRRLYWKYGSRLEGQKALLMEAMARNYLRIGNTGAALGRFQRAASIDANTKLSEPLLTTENKPLLRPDGQPAATIGEAASALEQLAEQKSNQALPDMGLPDPPALKMTTEERLEAGVKIAKKLISRDSIYPEPFLAKDSVIEHVDRLLKPPVELVDFMRYDRILVWSAGKLICFSSGSKDPLWVSDQFNQGADAVAWLDNARALVWGENRLALFDGQKGTALWTSDARALPTVDLLNSGLTEAPPAADEVPQPPIPQQIRIRQGFRGGIVIAPQLQPPVAPPPPVVNADGKERILHARPLSDRVIVSTTTGRLAALDLADGHLLWQTRLSTGAGIQQTLATDDFTVIRLLEGSQVQLIVLDSSTGQQILRRAFSTNQTGNWPINCALSPDGTLVWTTNTSIVAKDLYEPGNNPSWEEARHSYARLTQPDQLLIYGQEVLAVCDEGRSIERRHLADGKPRGLLLEAQKINVTPEVNLRIAGQRLYVASIHSLFSYYLSQGTSGDTSNGEDMINIPSEFMLSSHYIVVPRRRPDYSAYSLHMFSRIVKPNDEGKLQESTTQVYSRELREPEKITSWLAVEGGLYYLTGDGKLHWLKGAGK
jgi:outer membrane protein assembly factor BamB